MNRRLNPDFFWIAASQFIALTVSIGLIKVLTNELTLESYGYYSLLMTIIIFSRQIIYDPTSYVVVKDCGQLNGDDAKIIQRVKAIEFITDRLSFYLVIVSIIIFPSFYFLKLGAPIEGIIFIACVAYLVSNGAQGIFFAILNIAKKRKAYALLVVFDSCIKISLVVLFFAITSGELLESIVSITFGALISYAVIRWYMSVYADSKSYCLTTTSGMAKSIFINSMPLYLPTAMMALKGVGDRWFIAAYIGVEELAVFNVLLQLGFSPIVMIIGVVQTFSAPVVYKLCEKRNNTDVENAIKYMYRLVVLIFFFALLGCSVAVAFGPAILRHIVSEDYYEYLGLLPVFIAAGAMASAVGIIHLGIIGLYETRITGKLMTVAIILGVVISVASVIGWGFNGAIFGLVASNGVAFLIYSAAIFHKRNMLRRLFYSS